MKVSKQTARLLEELKNLNQDKQTLMTHCDSLQSENAKLEAKLSIAVEAFSEIVKWANDYGQWNFMFAKAAEALKKIKEEV